MSHLGRPKGGPDAKYSLEARWPRRLERLLRQPRWRSPPTASAPEVEAHGRARCGTGEVLLLENLRFHPEEEATTPASPQRLAALGEVYVNDAFGTAHRAHASTEGVHALPARRRWPGFLMQKELDYLGRRSSSRQRPFVAMLGGAKISGKIDVLDEPAGQGGPAADRRRR